ncbi:MAG: hypothetical protein U1F43_23270 [Myxococcota bacterium]
MGAGVEGGEQRVDREQRSEVEVGRAAELAADLQEVAVELLEQGLEARERLVEELRVGDEAVARERGQIAVAVRPERQARPPGSGSGGVRTSSAAPWVLTSSLTMGSTSGGVGVAWAGLTGGVSGGVAEVAGVPVGGHSATRGGVVPQPLAGATAGARARARATAGRARRMAWDLHRSARAGYPTIARRPPDDRRRRREGSRSRAEYFHAWLGPVLSRWRSRGRRIPDQNERSRELERTEVEMSKPRPIVPGVVVSVTRRTVARKFLLRPDPWVAKAFGYLLAHYAALNDVGVIAGVLMSNHYHLMVVDRAGKLPKLMNELNAAMARVVNAMRGREGSVWDGREPHYQVMLDPAAALSMAAYDLANPVAAGLVEHGREWPGFRTTPNGIGQSRVYARPAVLESESATYPEVATLALVAPPWSSVGGPERFGQELAALVGQREEAARKRVCAAGRRFEGAQRARSVDWNAEASSTEARGERRPVVAASDMERQNEYLTSRKTFIEAHESARLRFVGGIRDAIFPFGTWLMRVLFGVRVYEAPA